jgi:hypothetical protein
MQVCGTGAVLPKGPTSDLLSLEPAAQGKLHTDRCRASALPLRYLLPTYLFSQSVGPISSHYQGSGQRRLIFIPHGLECKIELWSDESERNLNNMAIMAKQGNGDLMFYIVGAISP